MKLKKIMNTLSFINNFYILLLVRLFCIGIITVILKKISDYLEEDRIKVKNKSLPLYMKRTNHNHSFYENASTVIEQYEPSMEQKIAIIEKETEKYQEIMNSSAQKLYMCEDNIKQLLGAQFIIQNIENGYATELSDRAQQAMVKYISNMPVQIINDMIQQGGYLDNLEKNMSDISEISKKLQNVVTQSNEILNQAQNLSSSHQP